MDLNVEKRSILTFLQNLVQSIIVSFHARVVVSGGLMRMLKMIDAFFCQVAATTLMAVCQRIGPDLTAAHVLPQLRELFDELAFSQEIGVGSAPLARSLKVSKPKIQGEAQIESRMDLA